MSLRPVALMAGLLLCALAACIGGGGTVPSADTCTNPPAGVVLDGLEVSVGEGAAFTPLVDDAVVGLVSGGQGARMLPLRLRATGAVPECLAQTTAVSVGGQMGGFSDLPLRTYADSVGRTTKVHYVIVYADVTVGTRLTLTVTAGGKSVVRQVWYAARPDGGL